MSLQYLDKHESRKFGLFSYAIYCILALACCIFDTYQPILIIFVDSKTIVLSTMYKYYFSLGHFCVTPVRQQDQCYQLWALRHLLLPEQWLTHPVTHIFCNNTGRQGLRSSFCWETLWLNAYHFSPLNRKKLLMRILSSSVYKQPVTSKMRRFRPFNLSEN